MIRTFRSQVEQLEHRYAPTAFLMPHFFLPIQSPVITRPLPPVLIGGSTKTGGASGHTVIHNSTSVLAAILRDPGNSALTGRATYTSTMMSNGTVQHVLAVSVSGAPANSMLTVSVDGDAVGVLRTDAHGAGTFTRANLALDVRPGDAVLVGTAEGQFFVSDPIGRTP